MKDLSFAALVALVLVLLAAVPASAAEEASAAPAPAPALEAAPAADAQPALEACTAPALAPALALGLESAAWHCPFNAPRCFKDDHCDAYCGDPRFGVCGSDRCCLCSG